MLNSDNQPSALKVGLGVASPLWPAFAVAASAGAAYWWFSRFAFGQWRPEPANLEAKIETPVAPPEVVLAEVVPAVTEPVAEPAPAKVEAVAEVIADAVVVQAETTAPAAEVAAAPVKKARAATAKRAPPAAKPVPLASAPVAKVAAAKRAPVKRAPAKTPAPEAPKVEAAEPMQAVEAAPPAKIKTRVKAKIGAAGVRTRPQRSSQLRRLRRNRGAEA
jgi:hypothetical protein